MLAIPELEASPVLQPALPHHTNLLQCRHHTSRKSPGNCSIPGNYSNQRCMHTIYFLKMSPPWTCLQPACPDFRVPWTVPGISEYLIFISSWLFVLNNRVLKCNILMHSSQMIAAQGQEQSSSCSYFKKRNIIAETKNWCAIYCLFISDSCFQL